MSQSTLNIKKVHSDLRPVVKEAIRRGWSYRLGKHLILYPPDQAMEPVVISMTPSDRNAPKRAIHMLKRAGLSLN